jgi:uncharacterized protein YjdB
MTSRPGVVAFCAAALVVVLAGCSKPASVTVIPKSVLLRDAGGTKDLSVTVLDAKGRAMEKVKPIFKSSAPEVADVDATGKITARGSGDAVITATVGRISGQATVRVRLVSAIKLALPPGGAVGPMGTVVPLAVNATDDRGEPADLEGITFRSSAPAIASVDGSGKVTLKTTGSATLSASIGKAQASLPVDVVVEVPAAVKVEKPVQGVPLGETHPLEFTVLSDQGRPMAIPVRCTSSDERVATADEQGRVTGHASRRRARFRPGAPRPARHPLCG